MKWFVYIVKCNDGCLYTGITTNPKRRVKEHNFDKVRGAKSLVGKLPVKLVYSKVYNNQKDAAKREREIKGWKRKKKLKLINREVYPE
ncbi:GIY-YIG nuclease family protein [Candidatus Microgenomates bacterium]|nr:GIY-YIG nuclease family protein [Candidatus Microgenomates bacterium]